MTQQMLVSRCTFSHQPKYLLAGGREVLFRRELLPIRTEYSATVDAPFPVADTEYDECDRTKITTVFFNTPDRRCPVRSRKHDSITEQNRDQKQTDACARFHASRDDKPQTDMVAWSLDIAEKKDDPCALPKTQNCSAANGLFASALFDSILQDEFRQPLVSNSKIPDTNPNTNDV